MDGDRAEHSLEKRLAEVWPPERWQETTVLLAVSGGVDSVALLRAMQRLKTGGAGRLVVAHFNHGLRGPESGADEAFVADLAGRLGLACEVGRAAPGGMSRHAGDGLEAAARAARYRFLTETAGRLGARHVATAHTADDQAETILHRIVRGTGIAGLAGIARARPLAPGIALVRPLLGFRRADLEAYLANLGQDYRIDSSNACLAMTRNRLRLEVLPQLADRCNPGVVDALLRLGSLAGEAQEVIDGLVERLRTQTVFSEPSGIVRIARSPLAGQPRYLVRELLIAVWRDRQWPLQSMGYAEWDLLADMILGATGQSTIPLKRTFPGGVLAEASGDSLRLMRSERRASLR